MADPWRVLVVDDDESVAELTAELLFYRSDVEATFETSFDKALQTIAEGSIDVLILDIRNQSLSEKATSVAVDVDPGLKIFSEIRSQRFLPVVFYTALPDSVKDLRLVSPFIQVVSKVYKEVSHEDDDISRLRDAIDDIVDSNLLHIIRELGVHIKDEIRKFMADFVENYWEILQNQKADLAHLLLRRLSASLELGAGVFADRLEHHSPDSSGKVHPVRFYVVPPIDDYRMGDILCDSDIKTMGVYDDSVSWYIILTPSCDLVRDRPKAKYVVLAECVILRDFQEYQDWMKSEDHRNRLVSLLNSRPNKGQPDRYHYLPAAWQIPDLIVDLQRILHIPYEQLANYTKAASLDSPFSEALANKFNRYMGRVGTPDLDLDAALGRMQEPY